MSPDTLLSEDAEGKQVVTVAGAEVGAVLDVMDGVAYVEPDPALPDSVLSKLDWEDTSEEEAYQLTPAYIETVTENSIIVDV